MPNRSLLCVRGKLGALRENQIPIKIRHYRLYDSGCYVGVVCLSFLPVANTISLTALHFHKKNDPAPPAPLLRPCFRHSRSRCIPRVFGGLSLQTRRKPRECRLDPSSEPSRSRVQTWTRRPAPRLRQEGSARVDATHWWQRIDLRKRHTWVCIFGS